MQSQSMLFPDENCLGITFSERFIPSPLSVTENKLFVPKPKDLKPTSQFSDLWKRMIIQSLIPETG